jgi:hypothetical protein
MSTTTSNNGRLCNQIIRNLCVSFIAAKVTEGSKTGEDYTFLTLYVNKMRYMITPVFIIMSIYIIIGAKAYLGTTERNAAIVAVVIGLLILMNIPITNVNDFGTKDTQPYNYVQAEKRTQFKFSSTVLWALTGAVTSGDLAINIANQLNKIQKFDNHVNQVQGNPVSPPQQQQQQQQPQINVQVQSGGSDNLLQKMQALNNKIRENISMSVIPM